MPKSPKFRSGLERRIAGDLRGKGASFDYEPFKIPYLQPPKVRSYLLDFILPNGIIVEAKGRWQTADRQKFKMIADTYPTLDIRFVFSRSKQTISKRSNTTYADYCESNGWLYNDKVIPLSWIKAPKNKASIRTIKMILNSPINQK